MLSHDLSISGSGVFVRDYLVSSKQIMDAYLLGLTFVHKVEVGELRSVVAMASDPRSDGVVGAGASWVGYSPVKLFAQAIVDR